MHNRKNINLLEEKLREYSLLNYHVLESMADWVRVVNYDGYILYANKAMKDSLGQDIVGMRCYEAYGNTEPCGFCISRKTIETKETVQKEEIILDKYFSIKSSPVLDNKGNAIAAVEVFRDVTRERKLELELIEKNKKMSNDLLFAKRLQNKILPKRGAYSNIKIDYLYKPSEMLSGDMFDIYYIDDDNIGIYICDVVGHGITASMMTMFVRQTMRAIKNDTICPSMTLTELHKRFINLNLETDKYFTIFYAIYNIKDKNIKYSNAGHNCIPIKFNSNEISPLKVNGFPISLIFDEIHYKENQIDLTIGDKILFYTDGVTEVKNIDGEEFGIERVIKNIEKGQKNLLNRIANNVKRFRWGVQEDDFAMLLMEVIK